MVDLAKLSEQQKNQRVHEIFLKRTLKQTHDWELAESFKPTSNQLEKLNETTKNLDAEFQFIQNQLHEGVSVDESIYDTISIMKECKKFFKVERTPERGVLWNKKRIKPLAGTRVEVRKDEFN